MEVQIKKIDSIDIELMNLLLLADPSIDHIKRYISDSYKFVAIHDGETIGIIIVTRIDELKVEIINVAVDEEFQGKGIGKKLIQSAIQFSKSLNVQRIEIGTGNSSLMQLALYQKLGFRIFEIWENHFLKNYEEDIFENGIQCRDMIRLKIDL